MATQAELETAVEVTLDSVANMDGATLSAPAPADVDAVAAENKSTPQTVGAAAGVTFDSISTADSVTDEILNRNATSMAASVDAALTGLVATMNGVIGDAGSDAAAQVTEFNNKIELIRAGVNSALGDVRTANISQNNDIASGVNARMGTVAGNMTALKTGLEAVDAKIVALDSVYGTDVDIAAKVATINSTLESLNAGDLDITELLGNTATELDSVIRIQKKEVTASAGTGVYEFNLDTEGFGAFDSVGDYTCVAGVIGNSSVNASVLNKTATGFQVALKSHGVHFVPQPWDAATTPVTLAVTIAHAPRNQVSV